jgi:hypothetical protein
VSKARAAPAPISSLLCMPITGRRGRGPASARWRTAS